MASSGGDVGAHFIVNIPEETFANGEEQGPVWPDSLWSWLWRNQQRKERTVDFQPKSHSFTDVKAEPGQESWTSQPPRDHPAPAPAADDPAYSGGVPCPEGDLSSMASAQCPEVSGEREALKLELDEMKKINTELNQAKCDLEKKCEDLTAEKAAVVFQVEELRQQVHQKSQEVQDLQQQREQCLALKHRYAAAFQQLRVACHQLKFENYTLHEQFAPQGMIGDQLQNTEGQTRVAADIAKTDLIVTDTLCSGDTMVEQKSQEARDLEEQLHQCLTHLQLYEGCHPQLRAAYDHLSGEHEALHRQFVLQSQHVVLLQHSEAQAKMEAQRTHQELQEAQTQITMLEACILELKKLMEEVYQKCVLLSAESDSIGDYIAIYQHQRASMKAQLLEKENCISELRQEKEEMEIKLLERQELGLRQEKKGWWKFFGSLLNPANQSTPGVPGPQDGSTSDQHGNLGEVSLEDSVEPEQGKAAESSPHDKPTAQLMEQLQTMRQGKQQLQVVLDKPNHLEGGKELKWEQEATQSDLNTFEDLGSQEAMAAQKIPEAQGLQEQRDQCLPHLQHCAAPSLHVRPACAQPPSEQEALSQQLRSQHVERRQREAQAQSAAEMAPKQVQEHLEGMGQENLPGQIHTGQDCQSSCDKPCVPFFYKDYDIITI